MEVRNAQTNRKIIRRVVERAGAMINTLLADRAFSSLPPLLPSSRVHVHEISVVKRITCERDCEQRDVDLRPFSEDIAGLIN